VERDLKTFAAVSLLLEDKCWPKCEILKSKQRQLTKLGKGNKPKEASGLTKEEINTLNNEGVMGIHSLETLLLNHKNMKFLKRIFQQQFQRNNIFIQDLGLTEVLHQFPLS